MRMILKWILAQQTGQLGHCICTEFFHQPGVIQTFIDIFYCSKNNGNSSEPLFGGLTNDSLPNWGLAVSKFKRKKITFELLSDRFYSRSSGSRTFPHTNMLIQPQKAPHKTPSNVHVCHGKRDEIPTLLARSMLPLDFRARQTCTNFESGDGWACAAFPSLLSFAQPSGRLFTGDRI